MGIDLFFMPSTGVSTDKAKTRTTVENSIPAIFLRRDIFMVINL
jgi:hypothetical protein